MLEAESRVDTKELKDIYNQRFNNQGTSFRIKMWESLVKIIFSRYINKNDTVLDLGAGYGEFINNVDCKNKIALDLNPDTKKYLNENIKLILDDCANIESINDNSVNVIFNSNFFEHLKDKDHLSETISECSRILCKGGLLITMMPNIRYAYKEYWDFYDHYIPLSDKSLEEILSLKGFRIQKSYPRFVPYSATGSRLPNSILLLKIYLRLPFVWKIFGKQMLVIAKKI
jgi:ubiquinone/menaquinone biosynthesis C-methylase UbiE